MVLGATSSSNRRMAGLRHLFHRPGLLVDGPPLRNLLAFTPTLPVPSLIADVDGDVVRLNRHHIPMA